MTGLSDRVDAVKSAISSVSTCTAATTVLLKELLLPTTENDRNAATTTSRSTKAAPRAKIGANASTKADTATARQARADKDVLSARERALLATEVVNLSLKALATASKPSPATPSRRQAQCGDPAKSTSRAALRRSSSAPLTPLQPRSLNTQSTSPTVLRKASSPSISSPSSTACLATVESVRLALRALEKLQSSGKITLPELQLENGMSAFVGRLVGLGLLDQACRELRLLKLRLDSLAIANTKKPAAQSLQDAAIGAKTISDLLDYRQTKVSGPHLPIIIASQLQVLRILATQKKPAHAEAALPFLESSNKASPINLLLSSLQQVHADPAKLARQMETLSKTLLCLTPNVASASDAEAAEARLSVSPITALKLQCLGLTARLHSWQMAGHKGDVDADILSPISRCLSAFMRRDPSRDPATYNLCVQTFEFLSQKVQDQVPLIADSPSSSTASSRSVILRLLVSFARECGLIRDAIAWATKLHDLVSKNDGSSMAKKCSALAQLLSLQLKEEALRPSTEKLVQEALEGIQGPLKGDSAELDELLANICAARKAAMAYLLAGAKKPNGGRKTAEASSLLQPLVEFVLQCPRFCLRWLGKPPNPKSSTKDFLRYEQRRQLLMKSIDQTLDSALMTIRTHIDEDRVCWKSVNATLLDSLLLLGYMGDMPKTTNPAQSFYVKISHFFFVEYNLLRKDAKENQESGPLKALRQSVDCIKDRPMTEKEQAQFVTKLERLAQLCKSSGRNEEALGSLQLMRAHLVENGVLSSITSSMAHQHPSAAWASESKAELLSRTLTSISKLEPVYLDWTTESTELDRAAVLEHRLRVILAGGERNGRQSITLDSPCINDLLRIYTPVRFPVRRLRILLHLLSAALGSGDRIAEVRDIAEDSLPSAGDLDLGEDQGLAGTLDHLRALYLSLKALSSPDPDFEAFKAPLATWSAITRSSSTEHELRLRLDGIDDLQVHLTSVADLLQLKGRGPIQTVLELAAEIASMTRSSAQETYIASHSALALQCARSGQNAKAQDIFDLVEGHIKEYKDLSPSALATFHLSRAECHLPFGATRVTVEELVLKARSAFDSDHSKHPRAFRKLVYARASLLGSTIALERGHSHDALQHLRHCIRLLYSDWPRQEKDESVVSPDSSTGLDGELLQSPNQISQMRSCGPELCRLFHVLFRSIHALSRLYAHLGMYQETVYYAEQLCKVARSTDSELYIAQGEAWMGLVWAQAANPDKALPCINSAKALLAHDLEPVAATRVICEIAGAYSELGEAASEVEMLGKAQTFLERTAPVIAMPDAEAPGSTGADLESRMANLSIKRTTTRAPRKTKTQAARAKKERALTAEKTLSQAGLAESAPHDVVISELRTWLLLRHAWVHLAKKEWRAAMQFLQRMQAIHDHQCLPAAATARGRLAMANALLGHCMEQMGNDPVYGVVHDSTISYPAIAHSSTEKQLADRSSLSKSSPAARGQIVLAESPNALLQALPAESYVENLRHAQSCLAEAQALAAASADSHLLHLIARTAQNVALFLCATTPCNGRNGGFETRAAFSAEITRSLTWRRERKAMGSEKECSRIDTAEWLDISASPSGRKSSLALTGSDANRLQKDYIDVIPESWNVISISLGEGSDDLYIARLHAHQTPFVLRLPLGRALSRDADNEGFDFRQGLTELREIIRLTNETCHDARDMTVKGAKSAWWADREALDARMHHLLQNVEKVWLGGFRGIFSQQERRPNLLAAFQKSLQNILEKHLPSRRQARGKKTTKAASAARLTLDPRIPELFVGLGDNTVAGCDFDEELTDLLYFVVDILQFNGERNAYDEIDLDAMVVETFDALHAYHAAAKSSDTVAGGTHTILILDKRLHCFPWESLDCLQGQAVSRVPSLACLKHLLSAQQQQHRRHILAADSATCILNPGGDLKSTQATFEGPLLNSTSVAADTARWTRIVGRAPTEAEFERALAHSDLLLYFGHGSGAQYIRGKTVRRLEPRCRAAALLMGCSSVALPADVGAFEPYGPVWNYLLAGCPAVVGTLWDVTDRDIDRFAGSMFEQWGLVESGCFAAREAKGPTGAGKGPRAKSAGDSRKRAQIGTAAATAGCDGDAGVREGGAGDGQSLVEAVARARDACRFSYLTAAAVCVYGIPVYLQK